MPEHMQEFFNANGYGSLLLIGLPMLALVLKSQSTQDSCNIAVIVIILIIGVSGGLFRDFGLTNLFNALRPSDVFTSGPEMIPAAGRVPKAEPTIPIHILAPLSVGVTIMILLSGAYKIFALLTTAIQLILVFESRDALPVSTTGVGGGVMAWGLAVFEETRANVLLLLDILIGSQQGDAGGESDVRTPWASPEDEEGREVYPEGVSPLPRPRPSAG